MCVCSLLIVIFTASVLTGAEETTYYCTEDRSLLHIGNVTAGDIHTLYAEESYYGNNRYCHWLVDAGEDAARLQVTVTQSDIQWAPANAICNGYDFMQMFDGSDEDSGLLVSFCGTQNPRSVTSSGRFMYITFQSNDRNQYQYTGIKLHFKTFNTSMDSGSCPPGWHDDVAGERNACYKVKLHKETWSAAQVYCNYDRANLVSFQDNTEADFVTELLKPDLGEKEYAWIGLNDIYEDGTYVWIDGISSQAQYRWRDQPHVSNEYWNCVVIRGRDWMWEEQFCTESEVQTTVKRYFVCKTNRVGLTELHPLPPERPNDNSTPVNVTAIWISCLAVVVAVLIVLLIVLIVVRSKKNERHAAAATENIRMNPSAPAAHSMPPTYEEAMADNK